MTVKVKGTWKKDEREYNGLDDETLRKGFEQHPLERHYVVALVQPHKTEIMHSDGGVHVPTVAIVQVEAVTGDDATVVKALLEARFAERTGRHQSEPTLFDRDDEQANADAAKTLRGQLPAAHDPYDSMNGGVSDADEFRADPGTGDDEGGDDEPPKKGRRR
jgi:hypothetical protein